MAVQDDFLRNLCYFNLIANGFLTQPQLTIQIFHYNAWHVVELKKKGFAL